MLERERERESAKIRLEIRLDCYLAGLVTRTSHHRASAQMFISILTHHEDAGSHGRDYKQAELCHIRRRALGSSWDRRLDQISYLVAEHEMERFTHSVYASCNRSREGDEAEVGFSEDEKNGRSVGLPIVGV